MLGFVKNRTKGVQVPLNPTYKLLLRTDQNGWIEVSTNGSQMWVEVGKKNEGMSIP